ncbi:MAG: hypothetical protein WCH76_00220 [Candidatus Riflemargulisbacteria bacterium]
MKKLLLFLSLFLCLIYAENNPIIIINPIPAHLVEQEKQVEAPNNQPTQPEVDLSFSTQPKKKYNSESTNCTLEFPVSWTFDTSSTNCRLIASPRNDKDITITLRAYIAPLITTVTTISATTSMNIPVTATILITEPITANAVYLNRAGALWERWQLLGSKVFNPKECVLVGVNEKISAVYKRQLINDDFILINTIAVEDIYIKSPDLVYVVTAQAPEDVMKKYNQTIKGIMSSFYVSEVTNGKKL